MKQSNKQNGMLGDGTSPYWLLAMIVVATVLFSWFMPRIAVENENIVKES